MSHTTREVNDVAVVGTYSAQAVAILRTASLIMSGVSRYGIRRCFLLWPDTSNDTPGNRATSWRSASCANEVASPYGSSTHIVWPPCAGVKRQDGRWARRSA